jgi:Mce-associated membrane protein
MSPVQAAETKPKVPEDAATSADQTTSTSEEPQVKAVEVTEFAAEESGGPAKTSSDESVEESRAEAADEPSEGAAVESEPAAKKRRIDWTRVVAYGLLPTIALLLAIAAGYLKWEENTAKDTDIANAASPSAEAMRVGKDSTIAILSYKPDTVEQQLGAARDLLTGEFRDSYISLTNDVVIPGAKQKAISAVATVPAAAVVSADPRHAVVMVFVDQTVVVGQDAPSDTASSVRVTLDKVGDRWLISEFDPV